MNEAVKLVRIGPVETELELVLIDINELLEDFMDSELVEFMLELAELVDELHELCELLDTDEEDEDSELDDELLELSLDDADEDELLDEDTE